MAISITEQKTLKAYDEFEKQLHSTFTKSCKANKVCIKSASKILREKYNITINRDRFYKQHPNMIHDFFSVIDTEEKAYFLGMFTADASLSKNSNRLSWSIKDTDILLMQKFLDNVKLPHTLIQRNNTNFDSIINRIDINSRQIHDDLVSKGLVPAKSYTNMQPYLDIPIDLLHHYIRGIFDGDGWFSLTTVNKNRTIEAGVCNTLGICTFIKSVLTDNDIAIRNNIAKNNNQQNNELYRIRIQSKLEIEKLIDYLYSGSTLYLDRKYDECMMFINR